MADCTFDHSDERFFDSLDTNSVTHIRTSHNNTHHIITNDNDDNDSLVMPLSATCRTVMRSPMYYSIRSMRWMSASHTPNALCDSSVKLAVQKLSKGSPFPWEQVVDRPAIAKKFFFSDFSQAWSFMTRSALLAEKMDHHPEWFNVYNRVEVTLTTHDCQGVSQKDIDMATAMEDFSRDSLPQKE